LRYRLGLGLGLVTSCSRGRGKKCYEREDGNLTHTSTGPFS
jgi:hypothetical protein